MNNIYEEYKTNIQVSRKIHRVLKDMKKENETFDDVLERLLKQEGVLK